MVIDIVWGGASLHPVIAFCFIIKCFGMFSSSHGMCCAAVVDELRSQWMSCKSAEDWLSVTRACEAKLQTASADYRCEQLSPLYCHASQVVTEFVSVFPIL